MILITMGYRKGVFWERELRTRLEEKGFFVVRASASGVNGVSPDLIVLHTTKKFAVECKAWNRTLNIPSQKMQVIRAWQETTGMPVFVAWKFPRKEWRFFPLDALKQTPRGFSLSQDDLGIGLTLEELLK